jgi:CubicO group peptidase (beta-lactamase class C family)
VNVPLRRTLALATLFLAAGWHAQGAGTWPATPRLDVYFDGLTRERLANGSIAITERGEVVYQRAIGPLNPAAAPGAAGSEPADAWTRYRIGSVTKLFTATLVLQLAERASITLDSKLAEFHPDLPNALDITYRDLLQHRSGLANYSAAADFGTWRTRPATQAQLLKIIAAGGARFEPGSRVEYNDSNYLLLGYMLEKIRNGPYADIFVERIADRIGLRRTEVPVGRPPLPSYEYGPQGWRASEPTDAVLHGGAGALVSTPTDLVRFIDALFGGRLVSAQSLASMRDQAVGTGLGMWSYDVAGERGFGHGGAIDAFRACVFHFPDRNLSIAFSTNAPLRSMSEIVDETLALVFDRKRRPPAFAPLVLTESQQKPYMGRWKSAAGMPRNTGFRSFRPPDTPLELDMIAGTGGLSVRIGGGEYPLVAFGDGEFFIRQLGLFLRFGGDDLVVRGPDYSYYLVRER